MKADLTVQMQDLVYYQLPLLSFLCDSPFSLCILVKLFQLLTLHGEEPTSIFEAALIVIKDELLQPP